MCYMEKDFRVSDFATILQPFSRKTAFFLSVNILFSQPPGFSPWPVSNPAALPHVHLKPGRSGFCPWSDMAHGEKAGLGPPETAGSVTFRAYSKASPGHHQKVAMGRANHRAVPHHFFPLLFPKLY